MREPLQDGPQPGVRSADAHSRPFRPTPPPADPPSAPPPAPPGRGAPASAFEPVDLGRWIERRRKAIVERWLDEMESRPGGPTDEVLELYRSFCTFMARAVSSALGPYRDQVDPLLHQACELYGSLGAFRGLAAGEVVEEVQLLREVVIRFLYADPPVGGEGLLSLRDVLRLNRALDRAVTQASVGHTDALFFALFRGSGVPERLPGEQLEEVRDQLSSIRGDFEEIMAQAGGG